MFKIGEILEGIKTLKKIRDQIAKRKNTDRVLTGWERNIRQNGQTLKKYLFIGIYTYNNRAPFVTISAVDDFSMEEATDQFCTESKSNPIPIPHGYVNHWFEKREISGYCFY